MSCRHFSAVLTIRQILCKYMSFASNLLEYDTQLLVSLGDLTYATNGQIGWPMLVSCTILSFCFQGVTSLVA